MDAAPDFTNIIRLFAALLFVLGLMGALALAMKKLGLSGHVPNTKGQKRLRVIEAIPLDARRRLVLLERDTVQHLVILGTNSEIVIETGIKPLEKNNDD
jgi:flagellar protein FliO/FliZ